jgi:enoyl-CoA hydratase/carnithine racemase
VNLINNEIRDRTGINTLKNPAKRNVLSHELVGEMLVTLDDFSAAGIYLVIIRNSNSGSAPEAVGRALPYGLARLLRMAC